ncbi:hypothetical protein LG293_17230 (plasmid) [Citricoccus nitrophenolicus]
MATPDPYAPKTGPAAALPERELTPEDLVYSTIVEVFEDPGAEPFCSPIDGDRIARLTRGGGWNVTGPWRTVYPAPAPGEPTPQEYWSVEAPDEWGHFGCCSGTEHISDHPDLDAAIEVARAGAATRHWMRT